MTCPDTQRQCATTGARFPLAVCIHQERRLGGGPFYGCATCNEHRTAQQDDERWRMQQVDWRRYVRD